MLAPAEQLPFEDAAFDLVTVCMAYHWLDQAAFLVEAARVLRLGSALAVVNAILDGPMAGAPAFGGILRAQLDRAPRPPKGPKHPLARQAEDAGLVADGEAAFEVWRPMTRP